MSWQIAIFSLLALVLVVGGIWFERSRPSARIVAAVAALAALGVAGRIVLAPIPNVVATTDVVLITGYVLGGPPGFAVGALSALISNFWLGQGPWTPWQMAGWGMVGVGGALLATISRRRLGRVGFAAAGAVAGLAYGALLDLSTMVSFGGEQSLDRYLALSARGIPFNIAHALGNAAIMFAAGPALVRIIERYRDRFEVEWEPAGARSQRGPGAATRAGLATLLVAFGIALPLAMESAPRAGAAEPGPATAAAASGGAAGWLRSARGADGGYGTGPGYSSNAGMTGWAMLGLESVGVNPLDVGGRDNPVAYLRRNVSGLRTTGDLERTILALRGAGVSVGNFGGRDLAAELRSRQSGNGSYEKQVNLTAYAILARLAAGDGHSALGKPASWLRGAQQKDGGFASTTGGTSDPDSTGSALQALAVLGADKPVKGAVKWLRKSQNRDGGWSLVRGAASNSQSTAWAIQGLVAAGVSPSRVSKGSRSGLDYLRARQSSDGHYRYSTSSDQTPVWVTAQALAAVEREAFPIAPVPRRNKAGGGHRSGGSQGGGAGDGSSAGSSGEGPGSSGTPGSRSSSGPGSDRAAAGDGKGQPADSPEGRQDAGGKARAASSDEVPSLLGENAAAESAAGSSEAGDGGGGKTLWIVAALVLALIAAGGWVSYRGRPF